MRCVLLGAALVLLAAEAFSFSPAAFSLRSNQVSKLSTAHRPVLRSSCVKLKMAEQMATNIHLHDPSARDAHYNGNIAQYLVNLHDESAVFNFCGGMMFQLVLSEKLRTELAQVAEKGAADVRQPVVHDAGTFRMAKMPGYAQNADADNVKTFHGREVRSVPTAAGGMGFVIHLTSPKDDPEGWTPQEVAGYDGWGHDSGRQWRKAELLESEGFKGFRSKFGENAFSLHHRFYLHLDRGNQLWLSAEDGCEGHPAPANDADSIAGRAMRAIMQMGGSA